VPVAAKQPQSPPQATEFDASKCGTISGQVVWSGEIPDTAPFIYGIPLADGNFDIRTIPNPNQPRVNATSRALAGAVVFLRSIDPAKAKLWDLPPARVELKDRDIRIVQGDATRRVGFVRVGESMSMASAEPVFHILRARGATYFSLPFPEPNEPLSRTLDKPGVVELSSGAGYYWANAHLFVADHPYFAVIDHEGRFTLNQIPAGEVELVVWHPGWTIARQDRDPETGLVRRLTYGSPVEVKNAVRVIAGQSQSLKIAIP